MTAALIAATASHVLASTTVSLTVDTWQVSGQFAWVQQTQPAPGFTPGQTYAGFFSGLVDGQRYVFLCTSENVNINVGQTYAFSMYSPDEFADTPFSSNGVALTGDQKTSIETLMNNVGFGPISGFIAPGVQSVVGVPWTPTVQLSLDSFNSQKASDLQMLTWEIAQDTSGQIDLSSGSLQWTRDGAPIPREEYQGMLTGIGNIANIVPEPQPASFLSLALAFYVIRRKR